MRPNAYRVPKVTIAGLMRLEPPRELWEFVIGKTDTCAVQELIHQSLSITDTSLFSQIHKLSSPIMDLLFADISQRSQEMLKLAWLENSSLVSTEELVRHALQDDIALIQPWMIFQRSYAKRVTFVEKVLKWALLLEFKTPLE